MVEGKVGRARGSWDKSYNTCRVLDSVAATCKLTEEEGKMITLDCGRYISPYYQDILLMDFDIHPFPALSGPWRVDMGVWWGGGVGWRGIGVGWRG